MRKDANFIHTETGIEMKFVIDPKFSEKKGNILKLKMPSQVIKELLKGSSTHVIHGIPIHGVTI